MIDEELKKGISEVLKSLGLPTEKIIFEHSAELTHGDYSSNIAMTIFSHIQSPHLRQGFGGQAISDIKIPYNLAKRIASEWQKMGLPDFVAKIEAVAPGFINIFFKNDYLLVEAKKAVEKDFGKIKEMAGKKMMVEFAHPNTHKELHIGHMRTLIVGEALARIFSAAGAEVFRANYQGDIGPHVAKSIWGTEKIIKERGLGWEEIEKWSLPEKAHLLGEGYVRGVKDYEDLELAKEIDKLNRQLYKKDPQVMPAYEQTRRWSLDYYDTFYSRFYTKFDRLFFESEVFESGKKIVEENVGKVFEQSEGAIIFDGEKYGLHKRVFITKDGNPTYEGKDMALAPLQYKTFPFDLNVHVVANEQAGYFQVIIKALELLDPIFKDKEFHLSMGMVQMVGKKMSSRTGVIIKVDDLLAEIKEMLQPLFAKGELTEPEKEKIGEALTIASIKYSMLRVGPKQDVIFDLQKTVSLDGDSGPYLEYTYARTQSVLRKAKISNINPSTTLRINGERSRTIKYPISNINPNTEESALLRTIYKFPEIVANAAKEMAPNLVCSFLYDLCQKYNTFYDKHKILIQKSKVKSQKPNFKTEDEVDERTSEFRILLTQAVGEVIKKGLNLLGIESLEKM
ncbi:MAG: Arginine--tRNA ligase [Microgenomates group bacterium ADurb.Bin219]|nr:MAG: Arginine--tRNA ligase [Microgenomates group bacterium ADurb.Bin219]HNP89164.1 arginine--tRNA ligase [Candidatus Woesebacteria bacterium]